jgi:hypothetical protein
VEVARTIVAGTALALVTGETVADAAVAGCPVDGPGAIYGCDIAKAAPKGAHRLWLQDAGTEYGTGRTAIIWNQKDAAAQSHRRGPVASCR